MSDIAEAVIALLQADAEVKDAPEGCRRWRDAKLTLEGRARDLEYALTQLIDERLRYDRETP